MSDWMDSAWQDFIDANDIDTDEWDADVLSLMKRAWLDGGKCAIDYAKVLIDQEQFS